MAKEIAIDTNHGAQLIIGPSEYLHALLDSISSQFKVSILGNPDLHTIETESIGIEEARDLKEKAYQKAFGNKNFFILSFRSITHEAQNALLKLFEEPPENTHFFLLTTSLSTLIPTLRSRLHITSLTSSEREKKKDAGMFLSLSPKERLEFVAPLIEEKNKNEAGNLLRDLEHEFHSRIPEKEALRSLQEIEIGRKYLFDRASSLKIILEHLSLVLPRIVEGKR